MKDNLVIIEKLKEKGHKKCKRKRKAQYTKGSATQESQNRNITEEGRWRGAQT